MDEVGVYKGPGQKREQQLREVQAEITTVVWDPVVCPANRRCGLELLLFNGVPMNCHL